MLLTDPVFYAIAIPVVLLTSISKTGIPGLFGGMAVPLLSLVIPPLQAAALMLPILCFIDIFGLRAFRGIYDRRNMPILLTGLFNGIVAGMLVFTLLPRDFTHILIGVIAVAFALNNIWLGASSSARDRVMAARRFLVQPFRTYQLRRARGGRADYGLSAVAEARSKNLRGYDSMVFLRFELLEDLPLCISWATRSHQSCDRVRIAATGTHRCKARRHHPRQAGRQNLLFS
ncbi:MAG TPA: sulfite exporter TauE/SafE family protein [Casimicrobiaceae bacterium]|jgi:hypothetical protein|nr:sulfite exporter TauE/SafE family protein [Casimicrobiaceae bacterium]